MRTISSLVSAIILASFVAAPAFADDWHGHGGHEPGHHEHEDWHWRGDIHHFHDYDFGYWRAGHWMHSFHEGRYGWWWVAAGSWYFYPAPVYPYPDPYIPGGAVVVQGSAPTYYYCDNPAGYYPYVAQCFSPWRTTGSEVVVTPPPVAAPAPMPVPQPVATPREVDLRQLNTYADQFYHVDLNDPAAREKLKTLAAEVEAFRKSLYNRDYNALEIMRDSEDLKGRISVKRKQFKGSRTPAAIVVPPGSTVIVPAQ